jgi:predicted DCC family thiol-disulfide oxidoreductase YuxK
MNAAIARWLRREYQVTAEGLAVTRVLYAAVLLAIALPRWLWIPTLSAPFYRPPLGIASLFATPPDPWFFIGLNLVAIGAAVCLIAGYHTRISSVGAAGALLVGNSFGYAFGKIDHDVMLIVVPLAGAAAGWGNALSLDARTHRAMSVRPWPVALMTVALGFAMAYAGVMKAATGWLDVERQAVYTIVVWNAILVGGENLANQFVVGLTLAPALWELLDWTVVAFEVGFLVAIVRRQWLVSACALACLFHAGNTVLLEIPFVANYPAYAMIAPWCVPARACVPARIHERFVLAIAITVSLIYIWTGGLIGAVERAGFHGIVVMQWPFTVAAAMLGGWWLVARSGIFLDSHAVQTSGLRNPVMLFDGHCNLCNRWVDFVLRRDYRERVRFASLQSPTGETLLRSLNLPPGYTDSMLIVTRDRLYTRSSAALMTLWEIGGVWRVALLLSAVPSAIRDVAYRVIARSRYRWFGRRDTCRLPTPEELRRFEVGLTPFDEGLGT